MMTGHHRPTPDQLKDYLAGQRWFAGKGHDFEVVEVYALGWLTPPRGAPAARVELIRVRYDTGKTDVYQLPLEYRREPAEHLAHVYVGQWSMPELAGDEDEDPDEPMLVYEALHDKEVTAAWVEGLTTQWANDGLRFYRIGDPEVSTDDHSLVLTAEQSNTSLAFGESSVLKVFRRVHHGRNPDIEIHEALTRNQGRNIAALHGWLDGSWPNEEGTVDRGDLAMFSDFFRTASDGWELAITSVRDLFGEADLHPYEVGGDFGAESRRLGETTAHVHADLVRTMQTDVWGQAELDSMAALMCKRLEAAVKAVPALATFADRLAEAFDDLQSLTEPITVQRIHGDLHLGQAMRTVRGWRLIDFEGEPAKSLTERSQLDSPVRDVAGMLRSFDYAAQHLLMDSEPATPEEGAQLHYRAREWADWNRSAFCDGYAAVAPLDPRAQQVLLRAYECDKAVYEVVYESTTRPNWIQIPLSAIRRLAAA